MFKRVLKLPLEKGEPATPAASPAPLHTAETVLQAVSEQLRQAKGELSVFGPRLSRALVQQDWLLATRTLLDLVDTAAELSTRLAPVRREAAQPASAPVAVSRTGDVGWKQAAVMLLENVIPALLPADDPLARQARQTASEVQQIAPDGKTDALERINAFSASCAGHGATIGARQDLLLDVLRQLLANVAVLSEQESWVHGQVASVETLLVGSLSVDLLKAAIANLKDVAERQAQVKESRDSTRETVERMWQAFMANLDTVASATSQYHARIGDYSERLASVQSAEQLHPILMGIRHETAAVEAQALAAKDQVSAARSELQEAQGRIQALEAKLEQMSELAREDPLTKSLNRRGMMEALGREMNRGQRYKIPLCIALLDIDNFKQINDKLGHQAGDHALVHLVAVIKATLRQMDVIARFGGEEFLLLLPNTSLEDAMQAVTRIQRELTRSIFMHEHQRVLVTFSAGAALVAPGESQDNLIQRVDAALYRAKREGKNRVVAAN
jgi:diguanylate cyclase